MIALCRATHADDLVLLRRSGGGDQAAFEALFGRHAALALRVARHIVQDDFLAEEVRQDAFVAAWATQASYRRANGSIEAWLMGIVRHRALDARRRGQSRPSLTSLHVGPAAETAGPTLEDEVLRRERAATLRASIRALPRDQRIAVSLVHLAGFSEPEVAEMLGVPATTIRGRVRTALRELREVVEPPRRPGIAPAVVEVSAHQRRTSPARWMRATVTGGRRVAPHDPHGSRVPWTEVERRA